MREHWERCWEKGKGRGMVGGSDKEDERDEGMRDGQKERRSLGIRRRKLRDKEGSM